MTYGELAKELLREVRLGDIADMIGLDAANPPSQEQLLKLLHRVSNLTFGELCSLSGVLIACNADDSTLQALSLMIKQRLNERAAQAEKDAMH